MDIVIILGFAALICLAIGAIFVDLRRKAIRPPKHTSNQKHKPHASIDATADAKRLQNGGTTGPGALGGGADFGP
jgi:hypothetical protein